MSSRQIAIVFLAILTTGCRVPALHPPATGTSASAARSIALPGASPDGVFMDYLAYDRVHHRVWVPAGNTASVDVIDAGTDQVTRIEGFPTAVIERNGTTRTVGP